MFKIYEKTRKKNHLPADSNLPQNGTGVVIPMSQPPFATSYTEKPAINMHTKNRKTLWLHDTGSI